MNTVLSMNKITIYPIIAFLSFAYAQNVDWQIKASEVEEAYLYIYPQDKKYGMNQEEISILLEIISTGVYNNAGRKLRIQPRGGRPVFYIKKKNGETYHLDVMTVFFRDNYFVLPEVQRDRIWNLMRTIVERNKY